MKCVSCAAPISPAFKHAMESNICPACGGEMMNDSTKELLDEIKGAFNEMPNDPEGLAGWLLSHYELRKIGSAEPVQQFFGRRPTMPQSASPGLSGDVEDQLRNNPKVANNKLQKFYQQAGIKPQTRPATGKSAEQLAMLAQQINGDEAGQPIDPMDYAGVPEAEDPAFTQAALNAMSGTTHEGGAMSPEDKAVLQNLMQSQSGSGGVDASDMSDLDPALQADRMDRLEKQQQLSLGGSVGKITRSS